MVIYYISRLTIIALMPFARKVQGVRNDNNNFIALDLYHVQVKNGDW